MNNELISKHKQIARIVFLLLSSYGLVSHLLTVDFAGFINGISYFTMLSNIMCFMVLLYAVIKNGNYGKRFYPVYGGTLLSITLTFLVYNFVLANTDFTMRAMKVVTFDIGEGFVHYLVPAIMWIDFLWIMPHKMLKKEYITTWLAIPVIYFVIIMSKAMLLTRFDISKEYKRYPYDFMNVEVNGIPYLVSFLGLFVLLCIGIGLAICVLDFVCGMFYTKNVVRNAIE